MCNHIDMWAGGAFLFDTFISITDDSGTGKIIQVWISQSKEYHKLNKTGKEEHMKLK